MPAPRQILIVRSDAVGDNVVTLPVAADLKAADPTLYITWMARPAVAPLIALDRNVDEVLEWHPDHDLTPLLPKLTDRFTAALVIQPKPKGWSPLAAALFKARIPIRIGAGRRWWGLLLYNRLVFENRHRKGMHECEHSRVYGRALLRALGLPDVIQYPPRTGLTIPADLAASQRAWLGEHAGDRTILLHIGSNGSSVDWPLDHMAALADQLDEQGHRVVVSTGFRRPDLEAEFSRHAKRRHRMTDPELSLAGLCALLHVVDVVVANSTGPLHVAGALGTRTVGLFPNMKDCFPEQWAPLGERSLNLVAPPPPGGTYKKRGTASADHMAGITVAEVAAAVTKQLA